MDSRTRGSIKVLNKMRVKKYGRATTLDLLADENDTGLAVILTLTTDWNADTVKSFTRQGEFLEAWIGDADGSMRSVFNRTQQVQFSHIEGANVRDYTPHIDGMRFEVIDRTPPTGAPLVWTLVCDKTGRRG